MDVRWLISGGIKKSGSTILFAVLPETD